MWWIYDAITCPTLLLRAADSEMLLKETAIDMTRRGPKPQLVEFEQVGTTATLVHSNQINVVKDFLLDRLDLG